GIDVRLVAAAGISGTVTDPTHTPLAGVCVQATTATAFGDLTQTATDGTYHLRVDDPGTYTIQFVDCTPQPTHATTSTTRTVTAGHRLPGVDAVMPSGAPAPLSGTIRNGAGVAVTAACAVVYLPNQYALFGAVEPTGAFTVTGIPSGTYALA